MASTGQPPSSLKKRDSPTTREGDQLIITPLGAGSEVGRSCVYMSYKGKTVMFDCGIHPAYSGMAALPYFDEIDPSTIDVLLITHFHLDHAASLPYFLEKTTFKGKVYMTHATKAIYRLLLSDYVKVSKVSVEDMLFDEQDILRSMDRIEVIDFHQTLEVNGIRFWCYTAGHVLGAAMFMVDIAGVRVLYTGDYSREEDRHLRCAETPEFSPDICIIESTYGVQLHQPRHIREKRFTDVIHSTVAQGGRVLIPAFALGRAQELLLILDEYWSNHPELHNIPIYYASPLAKRCMAVYQTYINAMNDRIRSQFESSNPFDFKHISPLKSIENFDDVGPSVVMASPGGLQSGLSRQLFDKWCTDKKNTCVIPGYVVEGTLAKTILNEPKEVTLMNGLAAPLNMQVHYISFSAHADFSETSAFLKELMPPNIILVHGEATQMGRLKQNLISMFSDQNTKIMSPKNCQSVEMYFSSEKMAKTIGRLAEKTPEVGETVSGLLVKKGFTYQIMAPEDLHLFSQLCTANVNQRITIPYSGAFTVLKHRLKQIYETVESGVDEDSNVPTVRVHANRSAKVLVEMLHKPETRTASLHALCNLSSSDDNATILVEASVLPAVTDIILESHNILSEQKELAAAIIANIVTNPGHWELAEVNKDGHLMLSSFVVSHLMLLLPQVTPQCQVSILRILCGIASSPKACDQVATEIKSGDGIKSIMEYLEHPETQHRIYALKLMRILSESSGGDFFDQLRLLNKVVLLKEKVLDNQSTNSERSDAACILANFTLSGDEVRTILGAAFLKWTVTTLKEIQHTPNGRTSRSSSSMLEGLLGLLLHFARNTNAQTLAWVKEHHLIAIFREQLSYLLHPRCKHLAVLGLKHLSESGKVLVSDGESDPLPPQGFCSSMVFMCGRLSPELSSCPIHNAPCEEDSELCLLKSNCIKPLVDLLVDEHTDVQIASVEALSSLIPDTFYSFRRAADELDRLGVADAVVALFINVRPGELQEKAIWMVERLLRGESTSQRFALNQTLVRALGEALKHGNANTRKIAQDALTNLKQLSGASGKISGPLRPWR